MVDDWRLSMSHDSRRTGTLSDFDLVLLDSMLGGMMIGNCGLGGSLATMWHFA